MTIYNQILYVTTFSATFSLLGLISAGQLMPALRWVPPAAGQAAQRAGLGRGLVLPWFGHAKGCLIFLSC